jgi:hypothetical protein
MSPLFSNTHLKATEGLYASSGNTVKHILPHSETVSKAGSASASKVLGMNSKLGSLMTPRTPTLGYYVKVPNSTSPTGFSISFVASPLVSLNSSTLHCTSSTSLPSRGTTPLLMPKDGRAAKLNQSAAVKTGAIQQQGNTVHPKLSTINNSNQSQSQPNIAISTNQTNILPPIKPKEEKVDLQKAADSSTDSSSVLSTPTKKLKDEIKKNTSSGVKKKLKLKLEKSSKKNSGKKQKKLASPKPASKNVEKSSAKSGNKDGKKIDKSSNERDDTFKKVILINPEKMKKILANRLRIPSLNINFKGQCSVTLHDKSRNVQTSFIVDDRSTSTDQSTAKSTLGEKSISRNGVSSCVDVRGTYKKEILESPVEGIEESLPTNKSPDAGQQNIQQTEACPFDDNQMMNENTSRGDSVTRDDKVCRESTVQVSADKPSPPPALPDPGPIPCPAIWSFSQGTAVVNSL